MPDNYNISKSRLFRQGFFCLRILKFLHYYYFLLLNRWVSTPEQCLDKPVVVQFKNSKYMMIGSDY